MSLETRVVLVEDNVPLAEEVAFHLRGEGFVCDTVHSAAELDSRLAHGPCDVVLLDLSLPDRDGLEVARGLAGRQDMRLVMLTARSSTSDRVAGFEAGADVYLSKPIDLGELSAVIRRAGARLRLPPTPHRLDLALRQLLLADGRAIALTTLETALLAALAQAPDQTLDRGTLESILWGNASTSTAKRLDILVHRLRGKFADALEHDVAFIVTRWGRGYALSLPLRVVR